MPTLLTKLQKEIHIPIPVAVFFVLFAAARLGQYVSYLTHISPAVIWPPAGIALAVILIYGYRMWLPVALAALAAILINPTGLPSLLVVCADVFAQTVQPLIGAYVLNRLKFKISLERVRDVLFLIGVAFVVTMIVSTITTTAHLATRTLLDSFFVMWTRLWVAHVLSVLVLTPFVLSMLPWRNFAFTRGEELEVAAVAVVQMITLYLLFWTSFLNEYAIVFLFFLLALLFWTALRFCLRAMVRAIFVLSAIAISGVIVSHESMVPLSQELFSIELFVILFAPIFLILSSLAETRQRVARSLEDAIQRLDTENQSKNEFIAILAHELRNPLAPIMNALELLQLQHQAPGTAKVIEDARVQANAIRRILEDLLDTARITQKKFKLRKECVEMHVLINRCADSLQPLIHSRGHTFSLSLPKKKVWLYVDIVRFEQIITNMLDNAVKYTDPGGHIELSAVVLGHHIEFRVRDNGTGIAAEDIDHVFESFRQSALNARTHTGLGLGLSVTKQLVEMHHGTIRVESDGVGKGSVFIVRIPLPLQTMRADRTVSGGGARPSVDVAVSAGKVLIVDDNEVVARGLGTLLEAKGYEAKIVQSGRAALDAVPHFDPQAIILDIGLPEMDGYEIARRLRDSGYVSTLVALTGYGQEDDIAKAREAGFDYHFTKPVSIEEIEGVLSARAQKHAL